MTDRITRVNEIMKREIARALFQVVNADAFDPGAATVTKVATSRDLRQATVGVSIRAGEPEQKRMLRIVRKHRRDIQEWINKHLDLKYTPRLTFVLDRSLEKGDALLSLLSEMDTEGDLYDAVEAMEAAEEEEKRKNDGDTP